MDPRVAAVSCDVPAQVCRITEVDRIKKKRDLFLAQGIVSLLMGVSGFSLPATAQEMPIDTTVVRAALQRFDSACTRDAGSTWDLSVCGPVVLVHAPSRIALANRADPEGTFVERDGIYVGRLPEGMGMANTSVDWGGERWAMALLPLPDDPYGQVELLAHESFHRIQGQLDLSAPDAVNAHLAERDGRIWLRLELRALAEALRQPSGLSALRDALLFRVHRHALFPDARQRESDLERQEGLAAYTGAKLAMTSAQQGAERVARFIEEFAARDNFSRSFAYATGPAIGLLLDRHAPGWRAPDRRHQALTDHLAAVIGLTSASVSPEAVRERALPYGWNEISQEEDQREQARLELLAGYRALLIDGPVLILRGGFNRSFNPNALVPMRDAGTVYPTGTFSAEWGRLTVEQRGALIAPDFSWIRIPAPASIDATVIEGEGWVLELAPDWTIQPGERAGDYEVQRREGSGPRRTDR